MTLTLILTIGCGAAWRRTWGSDRPLWAMPGYRWGQAAIGFLVLMGLLIWAGAEPWKAALGSGLALGYMTVMGQSIPHIWWAWSWLNDRVRLPGLPFFRNRDGTGAWTAYAEATCGAVIWSICLLITTLGGKL